MTTRSRYYHRKRHSPGTAPGTLTTANDQVKPVIQIFSISESAVEEAQIISAEQIRDYLGKNPVIWINVDGLGDAETIRTIGEIFGLHTLALEDTINVHQRPKTEDYSTNIYTVCRMVNELGADIDLEQISIFIGKDFVISFQEAPGDCWDPVRDRIRRGSGKRHRLAHADYLAYALLDAVVDDYFPLLEKFGDRLDQLEEKALEKPDKKIMMDIQNTKRMLHTIRHAVWPMRESLGQIMADENLVSADTRVFLRDTQDHVVQVLDIVESYRERVSGLMDIYLSSLSNRMNEVMRVLAVISTIFMPLTFIVGVYGMNFDTAVSPYNMPELEHPFGYPITMGVMGLLAFLMVVAFARAGWFDSAGSRRIARRKRRE